MKIKEEDMKKIFAVLVLGAAVASCATSSKTSGVASLGGEWSVVSIDGESTSVSEHQNAPFIGFDIDKKRVYGSTGCNRLTGALNVDEKKSAIDFGAMGSTRMMCPDMKIEDGLLNAFGRVKTYEVKNGMMKLKDTGGKAIIELKKK